MPRQDSSGDLLADRRYAYAAAMLADGNLAAAADLLQQVLDRAPRWTPAWMALAAVEERRENIAAAAAAYAEADLSDAAGLFGARLHLARLQDGGTAAAMPQAYVAALFDDYAPRFEHHLVGGLGYRGPQVILDALAIAGAPARFAAALDLGCGTGLMGHAIRPRVGRLCGVDLSPGMVAQARRTGLYDELHVDDIQPFLAQRREHHCDLMLAADVFVYLGALDSVLEQAARALRPGGLLAFTLQAGDTAAPFRLGNDLRFAHSAAYLAEALQGAGLTVRRVDAVSTRREAGRDVPGLVAVAQTPPAA